MGEVHEETFEGDEYIHYLDYTDAFIKCILYTLNTSLCQFYLNKKYWKEKKKKNPAWKHRSIKQTNKQNNKTSYAIPWVVSLSFSKF